MASAIAQRVGAQLMGAPWVPVWCRWRWSASAPPRSCRNKSKLESGERHVAVDALKASSPRWIWLFRHLVHARPRWNHHPSLVIRSPQSADSFWLKISVLCPPTCSGQLIGRRVTSEVVSWLCLPLLTSARYAAPTQLIACRETGRLTAP